MNSEDHTNFLFQRLGDVKLRGGDKQVCLNSMGEWISLINCLKHLHCQAYSKLKDAEDIRYNIKKVEKASDKSFLLIQVNQSDTSVNHSYSEVQAVLGGISLSSSDFKTADSQPALEALSVFRHTSSIARGTFALIHEVYLCIICQWSSRLLLRSRMVLR